MGIFKRHRPEILVPQQKPCEHKWTDIRIDDDECWYLSWDIDGTWLRYSIVEPYVCIHCKERKDVILEGPRELWFRTAKDARKALDELRGMYKQIKDRAIIEDAINDLRLVDREYLKFAAMVMGIKL